MYNKKSFNLLIFVQKNDTARLMVNLVRLLLKLGDF